MTCPLFKLKGYTPLVYLGDRVVLSRLNKVYIADLNLKNIEFICLVGEVDILGLLLSRIGLVRRFLRLNMGPATPLQQPGCFLVFYRKRLFRVDINMRTATQESVPSLTNTALQMLLIQSDPKEGSVVFGDYAFNPNFNPVNIYHRDKYGHWEIAYTFPKGEVNHIHGIFEDIGRNCLYILTGDFEQAACIWMADLAFKNVIPMLRQGQASRACWIVPSNQHLVFATDQQEEFNYLCSFDTQALQCIYRHFPIAGSSIFFSRTHSDPIVFSTAVEPHPSKRFNPFALLSIQRASGILSDHACVYVGTLEDGFKIVFSGRKDWLPYGLFQFGNIRFPDGRSTDTRYIHFYCSALVGHDNVTYAMQLTPSQA